MLTIRNKTDLAFAYIILRDRESRRGADDEFVKAVKKEIRLFTHKPISEERLVRDDGIDGGVVLYPLPDDLETMEEAVEYFKKYEYIHFAPEAWDCTGKSFTQWFKVVNRDGRFWAYHSIGRDV